MTSNANREELPQRYLRHSARRLIFYVVTAMAAATAAVAHHSFSMFDTKKEVTIEGTVAQFQFTNPHTYIEVIVTEAGGAPKRYTLEGPTPSILKRLGWRRSTLKPGDKAQFVMFPLRDGGPGGMLHRAKLPDGRELRAGNEGAT